MSKNIKVNNSKPEKWYAVFVKTGSEFKILEILKKSNFLNLDFHIPQREMRIRRQGAWLNEIQPMFPGYILVNGQITSENFFIIKHITDVYKWVSDENGPLEIAEKEIALIKNLIINGDIINISKAHFVGEKVVVIDGPLYGNEAIIRKVDKRKKRVKIAIPFFGQEKLIDIAVEFID